jgi:hypothetical protein
MRARRAGTFAVVLIAVVLGFIGRSRPAAAEPQTLTSFWQPTPAETELAQKFARVMLLMEHEAVCAKEGEPYTPIPVDIVLGNAQVALRQVGNNEAVVKWGPTARDLYDLRMGFYLDFPGSALAPGCIYERDGRAFSADVPPTIYAHIVTQADRPGQLALQYWFYWYFNDWNDKHESDWEGIQLVFPASTPEEALRVDPTETGYAQHEGGERADWDDPKLDKVGARPVVYSSAGSHASHYGSALYLGRSAKEGFGCDTTDGPSVRVDPSVVVLPDEIDDADDPLAWLNFAGRWGERDGSVFNGPNGPARKLRWLKPLTWQDDLRESSVIVPTGDAQAQSVVDSFCGVVGFGSDQWISFKSSPVRGLAAAIILGTIVLAVARRTTWSPSPPTPIVRARTSGQIVRTSWRVLRLAPVQFAFVGLASLPITLLGAAIGGLVHRVPILGDVLHRAEHARSTRMFFTLFIGSIADIASFVLLVAVVSYIMRDIDRGRSPSLAQAVRALIRCGWKLATAFAEALLVIVLLFVSLVGIPFGIRQLVRYGFLPQTVMLEGEGGRAALARSSGLVKGRWWRIAVLLGSIHIVVTLAAITAAVITLAAFGPPFWVLSLVFLVVDLLVHVLGAIAATLLYGDAANAAQFQEEETITVG